MQWSHHKGPCFSFLVSQKARLLPSSFSVSLWVLLNHDSWSRSKSCNWPAWGTPCSPVWVNNMSPGALSRNNLQPKELFAHHHFFWHFIFNECLQTLYFWCLKVNFYHTTAVIASALCFAHFGEAFVHREHMSITISIIFYDKIFAVEAHYK